MTAKPQQIQRALDDLENEIRLVKIIALALYERASKEDQEAVLERFQGVVAEMQKQAPVGTDSEILVDLLARSQIYVRELRATMDDSK